MTDGKCGCEKRNAELWALVVANLKVNITDSRRESVLDPLSL